jgi:hypothetical protein
MKKVLEAYYINLPEEQAKILGDASLSKAPSYIQEVGE